MDLTNTVLWRTSNYQTISSIKSKGAKTVTYLRSIIMLIMNLNLHLKVFCIYLEMHTHHAILSYQISLGWVSSSINPDLFFILKNKALWNASKFEGRAIAVELKDPLFSFCKNSPLRCTHLHHPPERVLLQHLRMDCFWNLFKSPLIFLIFC